MHESSPHHIVTVRRLSTRVVKPMAASVEQGRALTASSVIAEGKKRRTSRRDDALHGLLTDSATPRARPHWLAFLRCQDLSAVTEEWKHASIRVVLGDWECGE